MGKKKKTFLHYKTEQLLKWHDKGLISKLEAMERFQKLINYKDQKYTNADKIKDQAAQRLLQDSVKRRKG